MSEKKSNIFDVIANAHPEHVAINMLRNKLTGEFSDQPKQIEIYRKSAPDYSPVVSSRGMINHSIGSSQMAHRNNMAKREMAQATNALLNATLPKAPLLAKLKGDFGAYYQNASGFVESVAPNSEIDRGGNGLFSAAIAIRGSKYAGDKWYTVYNNPDEADSSYDVRVHPDLAANVFIADYIGRELRKKASFDVLDSYTPAELHAALLSFRHADFDYIPLFKENKKGKHRILMSQKSFIHAIERIVGKFAKDISDDYLDITEITNR